MKVPLFPELIFAQPYFLGLLLLLPLFFYYYYKRRVITQPVLLTSFLTPSNYSWRLLLYRFMPLLPVLSYVLLVLALARPQKLYHEEKTFAEGIDIMLVMDLSGSMLARDFNPDRLEVSKQTAIDFIDKRKYDKIGLVIFSGESLTKCPLTTDHNILKEIIKELRCGVLEDGTAIGMGLAAGTNRLKNSTSKSRVLILLTDGVNNTGYIAPSIAAQLALDLKIKLYTIGIGSNGEALMPTQRRDDGTYVYAYQEVNIDEKLLQEMANITGGKYFRATSKDKLESIYNEIDKLEKSKNEITTSIRYQEKYRAFLSWALFLLALEFALKYFVLKRFK